MARIPYPESVAPALFESQRPDSLREQYAHRGQEDTRRSIAHEPELVERLRGFIGTAWTHFDLTDRERELVLLAVAHEIDARYG